jgi:chorismate mutase
MNVEELRSLLVENGLTQEEAAAIKGKTALIEKHKEVTGYTEPEPVIPNYTDPEWEKYVMSLFTEDELSDGCPRVHGLRRLTEKLLGEIVHSGPVTIDFREDSRTGNAIAVYTVVIAWTRDGVEFTENGGSKIPTREFRASASSSYLNTDDTFAVFPVAIAETRAEARALRRALRLSKVSADEMTTKDTALIATETVTTSTAMSHEAITDQQKNLIKTLCDRNQVKLNDFINSGSGKYSSLDEVSRETASKMIQRLNDYQTKTSNSVPVPEKLKVENEG